MTTLFVTRHSGAIQWAARQGIAARMVAHLNPSDVGQGDTVMGTLPVHLAAQVCARGASYLHLSLDLPPEARGKDLTADDMQRFGAILEQFEVRKLT